MTVHRRLRVAIPHYSIENSLQKLLEKFDRDPMVGSKVIDLIRRYSGRGDGSAGPGVLVVEYRFHATPTKTPFRNSSENLSAIQRSDLKL